MSAPLTVTLKATIPTPSGMGLFLASGRKVIAIFVDPSVGAAVDLARRKISPPRPSTHQLLTHVVLALGARVEKVVIHHVQAETFFARLYLTQENELGKGLYEIDARPSDAIAIALLQDVPILVERAVWDASPDMSWALKPGGLPPEPGDGAPSEHS